MTPDAAGAISERIGDVRARIAAAARRAGRDPAGVRLIAVTKTVPADLVAQAVDAGVADLGENRAQELLAKAPLLESRAPRWHFIGRLQRNKVRDLAPVVCLWHSIDRVEVGAEVARRAPGARVLIEVNAAAEPQKGGCEPVAAEPLRDELAALGLEVVGLMTVPPLGADPRPSFELLAGLAARLRLTELSMGMSSDFEAAVALGATMVRVGTAIFGPRRA